jgi:hypothetical protein
MGVVGPRSHIFKRRSLSVVPDRTAPEGITKWPQIERTFVVLAV